MHRVSGKPHQIPIRRNSKSKISTVLRVSGSQSFSPKFEGKKPEEKKAPNSSILIPPVRQTNQQIEKNARPIRLASPADFREVKEYIPRSFSSPLPDERHSPELPNPKIHQSSDAPPKRINRNSQNRAISPPTKSISPRIQEQRADVRTTPNNRGSITPPPGLDFSHMNIPKPIQTMRAGPPQFSNMLVQHCQTGILNLFAPNNYYEYRTRVPSNESFEHFMNRVFIGHFTIYRNYITIIREARGALLIRRAH